MTTARLAYLRDQYNWLLERKFDLEDYRDNLIKEGKVKLTSSPNIRIAEFKAEMLKIDEERMKEHCENKEV